MSLESAMDGRAHESETDRNSPAVSPKSSCSPKSSGSPKGTVCLPCEVLDHISCGICRGPVAGSLLLSCSHLFCGSCLWQFLQKQQSCPTCSMALRSVPVRCLAIDKVAATIVPTLPEAQQQQYAKRSKDGQSTADKVNKMFWWLAPPALPAGPGPLPPAAPSLDPSTSSGLPGIAGALPCLPGAFPPLLPAISCPPAVPPHLAAANAAASTQLLQLAAAAQQFARAQQMAQVQQQLGAAAALGGSGASLPLPLHPSVDLLLGRQQPEPQHFGGLVGPGGLGSYQSGLQLGSLIPGSMCQV